MASEVRLASSLIWGGVETRLHIFQIRDPMPKMLKGPGKKAVYHDVRVHGASLEMSF